MPPAATKAADAKGGTLRLFCLLWLAGLAMRETLLVVPPVIPLIHEDLRMSETQIGLLIGLPLALFAIAAVPGSLLVARGGAKLAVTLGMVIAAVGGGAAGPASRRNRHWQRTLRAHATRTEPPDGSVSRTQLCGYT